VKCEANNMTTTIFPPPAVYRGTRLVGLRFQERDARILDVIYEYGGVVAKRQLKQVFWPDKSDRAMEKRLSKLLGGGYIDWPKRDDWRSHPIPEPICWLGWKGVLLLGERRALQVEAVSKANENQIRRLDSQLRKQGFRWMREPRWIQLEHDLAVVDFRLVLENSLKNRPHLKLSEWLNEGVFRSEMDIMEYEVEGHSGAPRKMRRGVCPDAFFVIDDDQRKRGGQPYRARFLLELDNATHDNPSFGLEKALPGAAYINSTAYKERFGHNSGRWLIVTTAGQRRLENLVAQTEAKLGQHSELFFFTTFDQLKAGDLIGDEIWIQGGSRKPCSLKL